MLAGRDRELRALETQLHQLAASRGGVVLVCGEPGIGKTRLVSELATRAAERGVRVVWGRCWEAGGAPAFWPWHEALGALAVQFPDAASVAAADPALARFALFRDVGAELARAAASSPVVVVLEDLHAADRSTLLLLEFLVTQLRATPIVVVGTYRDLEASLRSEIVDVLTRIGRASTVLALGRLSEGAVASIVRESIEGADQALIARVFDTTHGNPLFVDEILQQVRTGAAPSAIPLGVREIIRQRLALVSPAARNVLDVAAVLGVELGTAELGRLAPDATTEIDAAVASGLVTRAGARIRFAHALYREALYHDLAPETRRAIHRDAARALIATGAPSAEIAHHLLESGPEAAAEAIDFSIAAARQALDTYAFEDASALLERARLGVPASPLETVLRARVAIALGEVQLRAGDPKGRELCVEGARLARELGDASLLALAGLAYGSVFVTGGVDPVMVGMLEDALALLPAGDTGLRARTMARLAAARQPSPPAARDRDIELALSAVELGRRVATSRELLEILHSACGALYGAADPRVRMQVARRQIELAEQLGDAPRTIAGYLRLAMDHLELADMSGYEEVITAYARLAERFGTAAASWRVPLMRSMLALARDDFAGSERWQAEAAALDPENPRARRARAFHRIGFLRAAERHAELRASLSELRGLWMAMPYGAILADARVAGSLARIGATDEVRGLLAAMPDEAFDEQINFVSLAEAVWCAPDAAQAKRLIPIGRQFASRWHTYWLDVEIVEYPVERSLAYLHGISGDWETCERLFAQALRDVERLGRRSGIARLGFELGDLLVRCGGERSRATALLADARALAAELGLRELVAVIDDRHAPAPAPRPAQQRTLSMSREGEYYAIAGTRGATLRFKATLGFQYLAKLVEHAGADLHVLELIGSQDADRGDAGKVLDARAMRAYRERAKALRDVLEDAEERGDAVRAERARSELDALAAELSRGAGPRGKPKRSESAVDRARSAVQRRIKDALDRIAEQDPELGAWLRRVVHTGNHCSFRGTL